MTYDDESFEPQYEIYYKNGTVRAFPSPNSDLPEIVDIPSNISTVINSAWTNINNAGGGKIHVRRYIYSPNSGFDFSNSSNITLKCDYGTKFKFTSLASTVSAIRPNSTQETAMMRYDNSTYLTFENLYFDLSGMTTKQNGTYANTHSYISFKRCTIDTAVVAIWDDGISSDVTYEKCQVLHWQSGGDGVFAPALTASCTHSRYKFVRCEFIDNSGEGGDDAIALDLGIDLWYDSNYFDKGTTTNSGPGSCINSIGSNDVHIINNKCKGGNASAIFVQGNQSYQSPIGNLRVDVSGNICVSNIQASGNTTRSVIEVEASQFVNVHDNQIITPAYGYFLGDETINATTTGYNRYVNNLCITAATGTFYRNYVAGTTVSAYPEIVDNEGCPNALITSTFPTTSVAGSGGVSNAVNFVLPANKVLTVISLAGQSSDVGGGGHTTLRLQNITDGVTIASLVIDTNGEYSVDNRIAQVTYTANKSLGVQVINTDSSALNCSGVIVMNIN